MAQSSVVILLAPSKSMDLTPLLAGSVMPQSPLFLNEADQIARKMRVLSVSEIMKLMTVSRIIATTVHAYCADWNGRKPGKPAILAYVGDVYKGLQASSLNQADCQWAQLHLLIASGLYGLLRPFDSVQAYRLEMKARLPIGRRQNVTDFWKTSLVDYVQSRGDDWLCNCCSEEYSKAVITGLQLPIVTPVFFDTKPNGVIGPVPIYSKLMRGVMARWMIDQRVTEPAQLEVFSAHGYEYDAALSKPGFPAFSRSKMVPLRFS